MFYPVYDSPDALAVVGDDLGTALAAIALVLILGIYIPQVKEWGRIGTMVNRITDFAKGGEDGDGYSYQSVQARIAVAKGIDGERTR